MQRRDRVATVCITTPVSYLNYPYIPIEIYTYQRCKCWTMS